MTNKILILKTAFLQELVTVCNKYNVIWKILGQQQFNKETLEKADEMTKLGRTQSYSYYRIL